MNLRYRVITVVVLAVLIFTGSVYSDFVVQPIDVLASSEDGARVDDNAINGGGFTAPELAEIDTDSPIPGTWPDVDDSFSLDVRSWRGTWVGGGPKASTGWIRVDLGQNYYVVGLHLWNYLEGNSRGTDEITVDVGEDESVGTSASIVAGEEDLDRFTENNPGALRGEDVNFTIGYTCRYVRINTVMIVDYDGGFDEIRIIASTPAPSGSLFMFR